MGLEEFAGFCGCYVSLPSNSERLVSQTYRSIAEHNLVASIGSDFHGSKYAIASFGVMYDNGNPEQQGVWQSLQCFV